MKFVDVILPLPLDGLFTYSLPASLSDKVKAGMRVSVPLGRSKTYVAMAVKVHDDAPERSAKTGRRIAYKNILSLIDDKPIILHQQYKLWQWIANYYIATLGDVYCAAFPSGLKSEQYRPRTETCLSLSRQYHSVPALHIAQNMLKRSKLQQDLFAAFLALAGIDEADAAVKPIGWQSTVTRDELLNASHSTAATLRALIKKGIFDVSSRVVGRLNTGGDAHPELIKALSEAQQTAYESIVEQMKAKNVVLLHGVTSSGKTEIYIHLIEKALSEHKQVLYLLPEIALTVQIMDRLRRVFGDRLGIYHSRYSDAERVEIWRKQLSDKPYDIILGARSAVFMPFQRLGLVIVDEEHETSFKQQDPSPRYHARSVAIMLASMYGAKTLLGTATPSLESYHNAKTGKYGYVRLSTRYRDVQLPEIDVVDTKDLRRRKMMSGPFSPQLLAAVRKAIENGQQAILFQNRRGFVPMIECKVCGWVPKCTNCDVSLTLHRRLGMLTCHYCGATYPVPTACPNCGNKDLKGRGFGTEKIEDQIMDIFPEARVARMDLDTTRSRDAYSRIIGDFAQGKTNILIGTQMVTKGLDFDNVAVVGILNADGMLNSPDFRASEQAFTMMTQVSGRAGRRGKRGLVILQTNAPDDPVISEIVHNDYDGFYASLSAERRLFHYPPFYRVVYVYLRHKEDSTVEWAAQAAGAQLRRWFGDRVLGPDKPSVARVKNMNIRKIVLKFENGLDHNLIRQYLRQLQSSLSADKRYHQVQVYFDVDPL